MNYFMFMLATMLSVPLAIAEVTFNPLPHDYLIIQDGIEQSEVLTQAEAESIVITLKNACGTCDVKYITPGNYQVAAFSVTPPPPTGEEAGLDFPGSAAVTSTMRFKFSAPLPIYPATYIWKVYPRQQSGYYTTFFWGNDDGQGNLSTFLWKGGGADSYYGFHPYPQPPPSGTAHKWEVSIQQNDFLSPEFVVYDRWYTQAAVVWDDGSNKQHIFYWDLDTSSDLNVRHTSPGSWGNINPPSPSLTFGDAPWAPGNEVLNGILRGVQIYSTALSLADIQAEAAMPLSTIVGQNNIWYMNTDPTPTDISDKSGIGNHPEWVGSERPILWTGDVEPPPSTGDVEPPPSTGDIYSLSETDFTGQHVVAGNWSVPGQSLTIDFEITPRSYPSVDTRIISKSIGQREQDHYFMVSMYNGTLRFRLKSAGVTSTLIGSTQIPLNIKTIGRVTYDGANMSIVVNGVLDAQLSKSGDMDSSSAEVWIGANPPDGYSPFDGLISILVN